MPEPTVLYEAGRGVATLTLNRPDKLNVFNEAMHRELARALDRIEADPAIRAVLLTGAGRGFCAGQDLGDRVIGEGDAPPDLGATLDRWYNPLVRRICRLERPVVCAVNGVAAGAGANLAFNCDIVLAARSAKFMEPFCKLGLVPDAGGTYILPGRCRSRTGWRSWRDPYRGAGGNLGPDLARRRRRAADGRGAGARPPSRDPADQGLGLIKRALLASTTNSLDAQLDLERDLQREPAAPRTIARAWPRSWKAPGDIQGTLMPALAPSVPVAVIGAGTMGAGIAQVAAAAGHVVLLYDAEPSALARQRSASPERWRARSSAGARRPRSATACWAGSPSRASTRWRRQAWSSRRSSKISRPRCACSDLEVVCQPEAIFASNTSSLSITALAAGLKQPERMVGMHFFNPAPVMTLVEVVRGLASAPAAVETVRDRRGLGQDPGGLPSTRDSSSTASLARSTARRCVRLPRAPPTSRPSMR